MRVVPLGDVVDFSTGGTPSRLKQELWQGSIPWITGADIADDGAVSARSFISDTAVSGSSTNVLPEGTVILLTRTSVGKVAVLPVAMAINQDITGLTPKEELDTRYLVHFLRAQKSTLLMNVRGATIQGVTRSDVASLRLPLPPLQPQRRIASILDHADSLRAKRRQVLTHLDALPQAIFRDMFDAGTSNLHRLDEVAEISSGITKGRRTALPTETVPYLAVANVQAGFLRMDSVKEIDATAAEIERYRLRDGDLVLTEGGDPDKLGRGTVWREQLPLCLHQNHIFRVRPSARKVLPEYLSAALAGASARRYFLRSAKQTTGIASINSSQLRAAPIAVPPMPDQQRFLQRISVVHLGAPAVRQSLAEGDALFASLQSRAFRGEL